MMTTASAPPVVVTAPAAAHMAVAMPVAALDLDQGAVHRGRGRHAQPGGSGYGHCQQRKTNQGDTSHTVSSVRVIATSGTSSLWNVCSGAHEVNSKAGVRAAFPVHARPGSAVRSRAAVHYRPARTGDAVRGASLWKFREK